MLIVELKVCEECGRTEEDIRVYGKYSKFGKELCEYHYRKRLNRGDKKVELIKECEVCGITEEECETKIFGKYNKFNKELCNRHYKQLNKNGKILSDEPRKPLECSNCDRSEEGGFKIRTKNNQFGKELCLRCYASEIRSGKGDIDNPKKCEYCDRDERNYHITKKDCQFGMNLCHKHYNEMLQKGEITSHLPKICTVCGVSDKEGYEVYSDNNKFNKELCSKHYQQLHKHGETFRSIYEPNEIIKKEDFAIMKLYNKEGEEVAETYIDLEDVEKIKERKWGLAGGSYVMSAGRRVDKRIRLHRYLLGVHNSPTEVYVDHIDHNPLNNRKSNLRVCDNSKNQMNKKVPDTNNSGFKGVSFHKASSKWRARISVEGEEIYLGLFNDKKEAIEARIEAEKEYHEEFRHNNYEYYEKLKREDD